uniref:Retrovirus-related Pol polyprotein from transposon TNT 1-94 n=1 Tax=Cajanus cajan TaxID=3821 RepID=A0A151RIF6_CAJCA|nr:Retrovirus-related Pol polyprotein from transposon TNT 1-94 [Cajanus cajan]
MDQSPCFTTSYQPHLVCRLHHSIYGPKQSPRTWFGHFSLALIEFSMTQCEVDHSVFFLHSSFGLCTYFVVYVDDIVITGDDSDGICHLKSHLQHQFQMKDLDPLKYFLGIEVAQSASNIVIF